MSKNLIIDTAPNGWIVRSQDDLIGVATDIDCLCSLVKAHFQPASAPAAPQAPILPPPPVSQPLRSPSARRTAPASLGGRAEPESRRAWTAEENDILMMARGPDSTDFTRIEDIAATLRRNCGSVYAQMLKLELKPRPGDHDAVKAERSNLRTIDMKDAA